MNPRLKAGESLLAGRPPSDLVIHELELNPAWWNRCPHELSGGELQRFCVARSFKPETQVLIADEKTTMLDPLNQAHIWEFY